MRFRPAIVAAPLFALLAAAPFACTVDNPVYCESEEVNDCAVGLQCDVIRKQCLPPDEVTVLCESNAECFESDAPICDADVGGCRGCANGDDGDAECRALGGGELCLDGACVDCIEASDCTAQTPVCSAEGTCEPCDVSPAGDAACAARDDGALPLCGTGGQCVECREDSDCDSTLCDAVAGTCIDADDVVFAAPGGQDGPDCGDVGGTPCATLGGDDGALAKLAPADGRIYVRLAAEVFQENVRIEDTTVILLGDGADLRADADGEPALDIVDSEVEVRGLTVRDASSGADGIECTASPPRDLRLIGATVSGNASRGIDSSGCNVSVVDSELRSNEVGALRAVGGAFELVSSVVRDNPNGGVVTIDVDSVFIVNNFLIRNGNAGAAIGALAIDTGDSTTPSSFDFNTIVDNQSRDLGEGGAIVDCSSRAITTTHNLIYDNPTGPPLVGICIPSFCNLEGARDVNDNINSKPTYVDGPGGDYHLAAGSAGIDQGAASSPVTVDFDGQPRPQGERLDIGADEVPPSSLLQSIRTP